MAIVAVDTARLRDSPNVPCVFVDARAALLSAKALATLSLSPSLSLSFDLVLFARVVRLGARVSGDISLTAGSSSRARERIEAWDSLFAARCAKPRPPLVLAPVPLEPGRGGC